MEILLIVMANIGLILLIVCGDDGAERRLMDLLRQIQHQAVHLIRHVRPPMGDCGGHSPYPPHPLWQAAVDLAGRQKVLSAAAEGVY